MSQKAMNRTVFRSDHPLVVDTWEEWKAEVHRWDDALIALVKELDPSGNRKAWYSERRYKMLGLSAIGNDHNTPPPGWRYDRTKGFLMPARSKKEGKAIAKKIDALPAPSDLARRLPGMPPDYLGDLPHWYEPGCERHGAYVYVLWGVAFDPEHPFLKEVDDRIWHRVKLSEYYAVVEAEGGGDQVTS